MRLLHFDFAKDLVSTNFSGKIIPPYAILSHRWGDAEVLFEDIDNKTYREKAGYQKIEFCAKQAAQDQLQYFWVDTCCIDKWNLEELSKAINSMFLTSTTEIAQRSEWKASFRASAWFTQGWTLQELIAPGSVEFFSLEGQQIGDKQSLEQLIHAITKISIEALRNCPLDEFPISERMQWGKMRETTEPEDKIYCLLGILGVFMPASYGEGKEKAWQRLQIKLDTTSGAPSIIPFSQNDRFAGQESQLAELEAGLFKGKQSATMAILGPSGIGKSQLALEIAYRTRQKNKGCSVFWIDASNIDSLYQSYAIIAQKLKISGWDDEKADVKQLVKLHLSRRDVSQSLLIFDNADSLNLGSVGLSKARAANLIDFLPQSKRCSLLFTTTSSSTAEILALQNIVELGEMAPRTAQRMLENYLNTSGTTTEQLEAELLLQELSYLPLAIVQAIAYINNSGSTLQDYRSQLAKKRERDLERNSELLKGTRQESGIEGSVARTIFLSIDQIRHDNPLAVEYLLLAACVERKDISFDILGGPSHREREDAVRTLDNYALITRRPAESGIDVHRLVHRALRGWLQNQGNLDQWTETAIKRLSCVFPDQGYSNKSKWRRLLPHAKYALSKCPSDLEGTDKTNLEWRCAMALQNDGRFSEAEQLFLQVMDTWKRILGDEHPDTLTSMANLALTFWNQGRWKDAEELEAQIIETRKKVLGDEHPNTLTSIANMASTFWNQGRWKEAEKLSIQVMNIRKRVLGDRHPSTLTIMTNLASTYCSQGRWIEAEELQVQAMDTMKEVHGDENPDTLTSMNNLASTYREQGRWEEAVELELEVMDARKKVLGDKHPDTLTSMDNLASTYWNQGRWKEAEQLFVQVTEARKQILGDEHPDTLTSMSNLASTFWNQGRWKDAEEIEVQVIETSVRVLGSDHPDTLTSMVNLASTYKDQGQWKEAEELELQAMETRKRVLGDEHPDTLTSMNNLASTYRNQGRWKEAEALKLQVKAMRECVIENKYLDALTSIANLTSSYGN
ncbi:kinesin light chain 3 [Dendryphion nanum]|uniref:Kinesin light chain 3 n=1 Tax=Dendryphion nanum TaxID=256645 RepID=A0A9P9D016_9PLEO|nr:kinesin light chain 3 [Dendryphion nanum]